MDYTSKRLESCVDRDKQHMSGVRRAGRCYGLKCAVCPLLFVKILQTVYPNTFFNFNFFLILIEVWLY